MLNSSKYSPFRYSYFRRTDPFINRLSGDGIFTMGLTNATFVPLETLTSRAKDIIKSTKEFILGKLDAYTPALREQYRMQLNRLEKGDPSLELVTFPGLSTFYSTFFSMLLVF